jgi:hypothetical protein
MLVDIGPGEWQEIMTQAPPRLLQHRYSLFIVRESASCPLVTIITLYRTSRAGQILLLDLYVSGPVPLFPKFDYIYI